MGIPEVESILEQIKAIHAKKNKDYAAEGKHFENFERSAELISWFTSDEDKTFVNAIGTKLARLATLLNDNREPLNESVDDSFLDLCTYSILWWGYHQRINKKEKDHLLKADLFGTFSPFTLSSLKEQVTPDFSKLEGSGSVNRIENNVIEGNRIESEQPRYTCAYCGAHFAYAPQILKMNSTNFIKSIQTLYFDNVICVAKWKAANLDAQIV